MQIAIIVVSVLWVLVVLFSVRRTVINGGIIVPPIFSGTLCFALSIITVLVLHLSPIHLIWAFFLSYIIGTAMLLSPQITKIVMYAMVALAGGPSQTPTLESRTSKNKRRKRR
jgi:hypothetical protein